MRISNRCNETEIAHSFLVGCTTTLRVGIDETCSGISDPLLRYAEESPVCLPVTRANARETHYNA